ncbi:MAG: hypothetical protein M1374_05490, partial [Firmicutes bacterium]|nr:hypothetical protein [Bacillota bacterium]
MANRSSRKKRAPRSPGNRPNIKTSEMRENAPQTAAMGNPGRNTSPIGKNPGQSRRMDMADSVTDKGVKLLNRFGPLVLVAIAVGFGLKELWAETTTVAYIDDASVHAQMARWAASQLTHGHLPLDGWWPYLQLGSPQFLHYQSLSSIVTGSIGLIFGQSTTFAWLLYLLLATWPITIYISARLFRLNPWVAAAAALVSPLIASNQFIGYEQKTYIWVGYGLTTQLWGMWFLPLAWGFTYRAMESSKKLLVAGILITLTTAFHFMTGYLAIAPIILFPWLVPSDLKNRLKRAGVLLVGTGLCLGFVVIPVLQYKRWAAVNELLAPTYISQSYGARPIIRWFFDGSLLDNNRFPIITILAIIGIIIALARISKDQRVRPLLVMFFISALLMFGKPFWGPLIRLIPGSEDLFLRRFLMGLQLTCIYFAGMGAFEIGRYSLKLAKIIGKWAYINTGSFRPIYKSAFSAALGTVVLVGALSPAWTAIASQDAANSQDISVEHEADIQYKPFLMPIIDKIKQLGDGRVWAGTQETFGNVNAAQCYTSNGVSDPQLTKQQQSALTTNPVESIAEVNPTDGLQFPVYKWIEQYNVPEVGYTMRTAALMSNPEQNFDQCNPGDYSMFGIRYIILSPYTSTISDLSVKAKKIMSNPYYSLWEIPSNSYVQVVDTRGTIAENRSDIGAKSLSFIDSNLPYKKIYPTVAYDGAPAAKPTLAPNQQPSGSPGYVISERPDLVEGELTTKVHLNRRAVVLLSA